MSTTELAPSQLTVDSELADTDATVDKLTDSVAAALGVPVGALVIACTKQLPPYVHLEVGDGRVPPRAVPTETWLSGKIADDGWIKARMVSNDTFTDSVHLDDDREERRVSFDVSNADAHLLLLAPCPGDAALPR
eukprot:IDg11454t1